MDSLTWKRLIGKVLPNSHNGQRKLILLYHSVGNGPWAMDPKVFYNQMQFLKDHCETLSLTELLQTQPKKCLQVAVTFDDGYACLNSHAAPIMREFNIPAMVYLNTGWIATSAEHRKLSDANLGHYPEESFLTWEEVLSLHKIGWEFGSHGVNHLNFTAIPSEQAFDELSLSKQHIEARLNMSCAHFAYTWGKYSNQLKGLVAKAGYHYAASVDHGVLTKKSDALALPRMNVANEYSLEDFKHIIFGKFDFIGIIQKIRRGSWK